MRKPTPAQVARQVAIALQVGPLAAASSSMGPLSYRVGFRGGPQTSPSPPEHDAFKLAEQVALGAVAALAASGRPYASTAAQLKVVGPVHKTVRSRARSGATLSPLTVSVIAALETRAALGDGAWSAEALCAMLNQAASDYVPQTWSVAQVEVVLVALSRATEG